MSRSLFARFGSLLVLFCLSASQAAFNAAAQEFFSDFNSGTPPGMSLFQLPTEAPPGSGGVIEGGYLKLTKNVNSTVAGATIADFGGGAPVQRFVATFKASLFGSTCCGTPAGMLPADGFSFSLAPASNPEPPAFSGGAAEDGIDNALSVNFDTWDNGGGEAPSIEVKWQGNVISRKAIQPSQSPVGATTAEAAAKEVYISLHPDGKIDVLYGGTVIFEKLQTPYDPAAIGTPKWVFGGRTGGANDNHWIDDLRIVTGIRSLALIPADNAPWKYNDATLSPGLTGTGWETPAYDPAAVPGWKDGFSLFGNDSAGIYDAANQPFFGVPNGGFRTPLDRSGSRVTFYFRSEFNWDGPTAGVSLTSSNWVDDGQVVYLNGTEVSRLRVPAGPLTWDTLGSNPGTEGLVEIQPWSGDALVSGRNVVAVELHQSGAASTDVAFALALNALVPLAPVISDPFAPADKTVFANRVTNLQVFAIASPPITYQWYLNGTAIDPAVNPSAATANYQIASMQPGDAGDYFCRVSNPAGSVDSRTAVLTYVNDETPPTLQEIVGSATFDTITLGFDEALDNGTVIDGFNYQITDELGTPLNLAADPVMNSDGRSVTLRTELQTPNTLYTVTVFALRDLAGNEIIPVGTPFRSWVPGACGGLVFEVFGNLSTSDNRLDFTLLTDPNYPNNPRERFNLNVFDTRQAYPDNAHEGYGGRMRGLFIPPTSGNYTFYLGSDDASRLFLNPEGPSAAGKRLIAEETGCCHAWTGGAWVSAPQSLQGGRGYYIEAIYKEGTGGDYCKVAVTLQGQPAPADNPNGQIPVSDFAIRGSMLGAGAAPAGVAGNSTIVQQPADVTVLQNTTATFTVGAQNEYDLPLCYQWQRDGVDIPGATGPSYSLLAGLADSGAVFSARVSTYGTELTSASATLTVEPDVTPPACVKAEATLTFTNVVVTFSELMDPAPLADNFNFIVDGFGVSASIIDATGTKVILSLDGTLTPGQSYTVTVQNVLDLAGNAIGSCTLNFQVPAPSAGFVTFQTFNTGPGVAVADLFAYPGFPNNPQETFYLSAFDTRGAYPNDSHDNYGGWLAGYFVPPTSGNWIFYLRSDDASQLYLNPTGSDPAGKVLIAEEPTCCRAFSAVPSLPQALTAGQPYLIEAYVKEGGGGDYCQVAAKLESDPSNPDTLRPIPGIYLATLADPTGATVAITQQPVDQVFLVTPDTLLDENFNSGNGGFTAETAGAFAATPGPWRYDDVTGSWRADGHAAELNEPMTSTLTTPAVTVTRSGPVTLTLEHRYSFEFDGTRWDGGQVQISVNGSPFSAVPDAAFTQNGYGGNTIASGSRSTLAGQPGFTGESAGHGAGTFITSRATGNFNAGDTVRLRFVYAGDTNTRGPVPNWQINHVVIAMGGQGPQPVTFSVGVNASRQPVAYQWFRDSGSGFVPIPGATAATFSILPVCNDNDARFRVQVYIPGAQATSDDALLTVTAPNTAPVFAVTPPPAGSEDSGAVSVPGVVHDLQPGSNAAALTTPSIGLNFGADEVSGSASGTLPAGTKAGVVAQANWNNLSGASGSAAGLRADYAGTPQPTLVSVAWTSPNTWSSTGRGEENNGFPAGSGDRILMTGYIDTTDQAAGAATVTVSGLGPEFTAGGYDVIVYALGGVLGRGGAYTIAGTTKFGTAPASPAAHSEDPGVGLADNGTYVKFTGLTGSSFTLVADASVAPGSNFRAPINGIQIVASQGTQVPNFGYAANFTTLPAGSVSTGTTPPFVDAGHLVLSRSGIGNEQNYWTVPLGAVPLMQSFKASWKALLNPVGGADGFSFNIGQNVATGFTAEEGASAGLSVTVDTWDNGGGEVGIETRWNGARLSFLQIGGGSVNGPPALNKNEYVNATVEVAPNGVVTFNYDGFITTGQIPGYNGLSANTAMFAARTGGASEDAFIDDLQLTGYGPQACGDESGQTVELLVSNDNPSLFAVQPAIGPDGSLTYTPAAGACGTAIVTVVAQDDGGTAFGGLDTSTPRTFTLAVNCVNDCPTANPLNLTVGEAGSVNFQLSGNDPEGDGLQYNLTRGPAHGTVVLQGTGAGTYAPNPGYCGPDSFAFVVNDGSCNSAEAEVTVTVADVTPPLVSCPGDITVDATGTSGAVVTYVASATDPCGLATFACTPPSGSTFARGTTRVECAAVNAAGLTGRCQFNVTVVSPNDPPVCVASVGPETCLLSFAGDSRRYALAINDTDACVVLDGSGSSDPDNDPLGYLWTSGTNVLGTAAVVTNCLPLGCHTITLAVSDGQDQCLSTIELCVITPAEAIDQCIALVENTTVERKNKRPLLASLKAAQASFDRGSYTSGLNQLEAFKNKVRAQISRQNPAEAQAFTDAVQKVLDAIDCAAIVASQGH